MNMDLFSTKGRVIKQAFPKMREIPVRVSRRRHAFVHLDNVYAVPWHFFRSQCA